MKRILLELLSALILTIVLSVVIYFTDGDFHILMSLFVFISISALALFINWFVSVVQKRMKEENMSTGDLLKEFFGEEEIKCPHCFKSLKGTVHVGS